MAAREGDEKFTISPLQSLRWCWHNYEVWYSCVDFCQDITHTPNPTRYWSDLKIDLKTRENIDMYRLGVKRLKLLAGDHKMRETDCATMTILFQILQYIKSNHAIDEKQWLARVGARYVKIHPEHTV